MSNPIFFACERILFLFGKSCMYIVFNTLNELTASLSKGTVTRNEDRKFDWCDPSLQLCGSYFNIIIS